MSLEKILNNTIIMVFILNIGIFIFINVYYPLTFDVVSCFSMNFSIVAGPVLLVLDKFLLSKISGKGFSESNYSDYRIILNKNSLSMTSMDVFCIFSHISFAFVIVITCSNVLVLSVSRYIR
jgi:hypothetical protein